MAADGAKPVTIVIGVDGSHVTDHALQWYLKNLHKPENRVLFIHSLEIRPMPMKTIHTTSDVMMGEFEKAKKHGGVIEKKYKDLIDQNQLTGEYRLMMGKPGEVLCHVSKTEHADHIIVGAHGHGAVARAIIGSVSSYVVHHAHCPVTVIRKDAPV